MALVICYDIEDNKARDKMAKLLLKVGLSRIQLSVFAGSPRSEVADKIQHTITKWWKDRPANDKLYMFIVPDDNLQNAKGFGTMPDWDIILGKVKYRIL